MCVIMSGRNICWLMTPLKMVLFNYINPVYSEVRYIVSSPL